MKATGVVLSGGRSSRMLTNKAFVEVQGHKIIDSVLGKLSAVMDDIILVTNDPDTYEKYQTKSVRIVTDIIPGKGPLSGIHAGIVHAKHDYIAAVACDMPFLDMGFINYMIGQVEGWQAVVPKIGDYFQPLCAVYAKGWQDLLENSLLNDQLKISRLYEKLSIKYIEEAEIIRFGDPDKMFFNVNNQDDLQRAEMMAREVI